MVAGKDTPINLFAVVVRMIVTVPRGSDIAGRPVCEQAWRHFIRSQATRQEILILVPDARYFPIVELNGRMRPEFIPLRFRVVPDSSRFRFREFCHPVTRKGFCVEVCRGISMVLRDGNPVLAAASCRVLLK